MNTQPKKTKYRFMQLVPFFKKKAKGNKFLTWGQFGLRAQEGGYISTKQIEAARKSITKFLKKIKASMKINIFPHLAKTKKPLEVRMGSGKGAIDIWVAVAKEGTIMFEIKDAPRDIAFKALKAASHKLPVKCKVIEKEVI